MGQISASCDLESYYLVFTYVVFERLSVMHYTFQLVEFLVQNSLSALPLPENEILGRSWHFEFDLVYSNPPPPENKNEILGRSRHFEFDLVWSTPPPRVSGSSYMETNFCIPRGYHLVLSVKPLLFEWKRETH